MFRHRLATEADYYRLPEPPSPPIRPESFALCTFAVIPGCTAAQWAGHRQLLAWAFEAAQEAVRPSILERDPFACWN
jgi:hypothetical protein